MPKKYFCEYCGQKFHSAVGPSGCVKTSACRGLNYPPQGIVGSYRVRACAVLLARTAGDMLEKSPAARSCVRTQKMGQGIKKWSDRAYKALEANTPISLGRAKKVHHSLTRFVQKELWSNKSGIPNLYLLELAVKYADAAKEFVLDRIESGEHRHFWFESAHPEWLLYDAVSMPLAIFVSKMKERKQTSKSLDALILGYSKFSKTMGPPEGKIIEDMLDHCWRDELRSWRYLEGCMETAARYIRENGTEASKDLSRFDVFQSYWKLYDHIWGDGMDEERPQAPSQPKMKVWLVNGRFWVAAERRGDAIRILARDTGHVGSVVEGVDSKKKLFHKDGSDAGTVADLLDGIFKPQFIGVA